MKALVALALLSFTLLGCRSFESQVLSATPNEVRTESFDYGGHWVGRLQRTYPYYNEMADCEGDFRFSEGTELFNFESGQYICDGETEKWPSFELEHELGRLYYFDDLIGDRSDSKIEMKFQFPEYTLLVRANVVSKNAIDYEEIYTDASNGLLIKAVTGRLVRIRL